MREEALGIERQYSLDGSTFSYLLPPELETPEFQRSGSLTWLYVGQAEFRAWEDVQEGVWSQVPETILTGLSFDPESYLGVGVQTKIDKYGRLWLLYEADLEAARQAVVDYNTAVQLEFSHLETFTETTGIEFPENAGEWRYTQPMYDYYWYNCSGGTEEYEITNYTYDVLAEVSGTLSDRQRKIVILWRGSSHCSGTMVDNHWLLTAAHCVASSTGYYSTTNMQVCTLENLQSGATCYDVENVVAPGGVFDGQAENDYAVVEIDGTTSGIGWFALTDEWDYIVDNYEQFVRGYPGYRGSSCDSNQVSDNAQTVDDAYNGLNMWSADGWVEATPSGRMDYNISGGSGMSGSPVFYCPNGSGCDDGHYITGVMAQYEFDPSYFMGPKARSIRDWVITNTP